LVTIVHVINAIVVYFCRVKFILTILLLLPLAVFSQNLVPNPGFENFNACPNNISQITRATGWFSPSLATPDYYNYCDPTNVFSVPYNAHGYQLARTGNGYAGIFAASPLVSYREYISIRLIEPLTAGVKYKISFFVCLKNKCYDTISFSNCGYASSQMGLYLSNDSIHVPNTSLLTQTPQVASSVVINDTLLWTEIGDTITAVGGEKYVTIGCFADSANILYQHLSGNSFDIKYSGYYIDDVGVERVIDPIIKPVIDPVLQPTSGTTIDFPNVVTPNHDLINDEFSFNYLYFKSFSLNIYNRWGTLVFETSSPEPWKPENVTSGVYFYTIIGVDLEDQPYKNSGFIHVFE
jgi:OOP family OmpA-OmpF porin